jgi:SAM-dependent methyltransferase
VRPGELVLDIGSGYGRVLVYLEQKGFEHVFGLESDFRYFKKNPLSVVCGRGEQAPFKDESFGAVFSIGVFSYILEDQKRMQLSNEIQRILKSRGFLFLSCFMISGDEYHQNKYREGQKEYGTFGIFESDSRGIFRHSRENELRELLNKFRILSWKTRPFMTMNKRPASGVIIEAQKH